MPNNNNTSRRLFLKKLGLVSGAFATGTFASQPAQAHYFDGSLSSSSSSSSSYRGTSSSSSSSSSSYRGGTSSSSLPSSSISSSSSSSSGACAAPSFTNPAQARTESQKSVVPPDKDKPVGTPANHVPYVYSWKPLGENSYTQVFLGWFAPTQAGYKAACVPYNEAVREAIKCCRRHLELALANPL